jgi:hypothetical protein
MRNTAATREGSCDIRAATVAGSFWVSGSGSARIGVRLVMSAA